MSYYDNLRGVFQTKLDALNAMDQFRTAARLAKGDTGDAAPVAGRHRTSATPGSGGWFGLIVAIAAAIVGVVAANGTKTDAR